MTAPRKKVFIGGLPSSGTTVFAQTLWEFGFAQGPTYGDNFEGLFDPACPDVLKYHENQEPVWRHVAQFEPEDAEVVRAWIDSYDGGSGCFMEKSPPHLTKFQALQRLYGDDAYFIVMQRDPLQVIRSRKKRNPGLSSTVATLFLRQTLHFHTQWRHDLGNFLYLRYEDFCEQPGRVLDEVFAFLGLPQPGEKVAAVCAKMEIWLKHRHEDWPDFKPQVFYLAGVLANEWGYDAF